MGGDLCVRRGRPAAAGAEANADQWRQGKKGKASVGGGGGGGSGGDLWGGDPRGSRSIRRAEAGGMRRGVVVLRRSDCDQFHVFMACVIVGFAEVGRQSFRPPRKIAKHSFA